MDGTIHEDVAVDRIRKGMWITMNKLLGHLRRGALAGLCAALLLGSVGCGTESEESAASRKDPVSSQIVDKAYDSRIKAA